MKIRKLKRLYAIDMDTNKHILTDKDFKRLIVYVVTEAKNHPNSRTKTLELIVLLLTHNLSSRELLNLNIGDVHCSDGENKITVRNTRTGEARDIYLVDVLDGLETKTKEYLETCRPGAKPEEPLFVSRNGTRTHRQTLYYMFAGHDSKSGHWCQLGIGSILGIKHLSPAMIARTVSYQTVGPEGEKIQQSKLIGITLTKFMKACCEGSLGKSDLGFYRQGLNYAHNKRCITLPKPIKPWRPKKNRGQAKEYNPLELVLHWPKCQKKLPELGLPALDPDRVRITLEIYGCTQPSKTI